ncbi:MAG: rRNA methyltransferase [Verrucomicrobiales bacterium]|nr:rRNA methyltransferase [Verrucomicrobiales bacterium]
MKSPRPARASATPPGTAPRQGQEVRRHQHTDYGKAPGIGNEDDLYRIVKDQKAPLILILDGVTDPHNLGACLRTADGAGVHAVVAPKDRAATLTETVRHIACGGAESVPFIQVTNLARTMEKLQALGLWLVGLADKGGKPVYDLDLKGPIGVVLGAEGPGMRRLTGEKCDFLARIPMQGKVECLNVSVATGVVLFECVRQRR